MPYGSRYRVPLRRRREKKTDYQARKAFIVSGKPRLVARSSTNNTIAQIIIAKPIGDFVLASAHSRELVKKYGWKAATGNVPAAYLTGLLCGLKAKKSGIAEAILDLGLVSPTNGSKVFSTMAGVVDAGVAIPHSDEKIVKERARGDHIVEYAESLGAPEEYTPKFSKVIANGLKPQEFGEHFNKVKTDIFAAFGITWKPEARQPKPVKKPEAKKPEAKPAGKVEVKKPEAKVEAPKPKAPEHAVKAEAVHAKPATVVAKPSEAKAEAKAEEAPKAEAKPKAEHKAKAEEKPEAKAKAEKKPRAEKKPKAEKVEAKPKAEKKAKAEEAEKKPAKTTKAPKAAKAGGKKE
jgi:large subunit ribosomal protein L18